MPSAHEPMSKGSESKSLSAKPFSLSIGARPPAEKSRKRPHYSLDNASDSDDDAKSGPQWLSGYDGSAAKIIGGQDEDTKKDPLVIAQQKNRDWRKEAAKRQRKNLLPAEEQARRAAQELNEHNSSALEEKRPVYGLLVARRSSPEEHKEPDPAPQSALEQTKPAASADDEALQALLGDHSGSSRLVIPNVNSSSNELGSLDREAESFRSDVDSHPDVPSLADYAAVPIEEFGKALLRGMGWKEGQELGRPKNATSQPREVKRRPALLGIGAREVPEGLEELGAWGKGVKKSRRIDTSYMPLVMQNSKTGEKLTEEELASRKPRDTVLTGDKSRYRDSDGRSDHSRRERDNGSHKRHDSRRRDKDASRRHRRDDDTEAGPRHDQHRRSHWDYDEKSERRQRNRHDQSRSYDDEKRDRHRHRYRDHERHQSHDRDRHK